MGSLKTRLIVRNDAEISAKVRTSELWRGEYVRVTTKMKLSISERLSYRREDFFRIEEMNVPWYTSPGICQLLLAKASELVAVLPSHP